MAGWTLKVPGTSDRFSFLDLRASKPTTDGAFARNAGFTVSLTGAGTQTTGVVRCDQSRPLDLAARNGRKLESVPQHILDDVLAKLATLFT